MQGVEDMFESIKLDRNDTKPMYMQLYEKISSLIDAGDINGGKLPSIRALAKALDVNNVTVISAYRELEKEGYVYSQKGSGTFVREKSSLETPASVEEGDIELMLSGIFPLLKESTDFASVSPTPDLFPIEEFKEALIEVLDRDKGEAFLYPEVTGYGPLRESISKFLKDNYSIETSKEQILITSGGQQGLDIISKTLVGQNDVILVENPTYPGAYSAFKSRGAKIIGIPMTKDGIDTDALRREVRKLSPKFIYLMPNFQSPTTICYSREKKLEVLKLAKEYGFYIIEDDFLTDLNFSPEQRKPMKTFDDSDCVIFIKSFSKIFMPGVRIGFMTLPAPLFRDILKAKHSTDVSSSGYLQRAFDLYLRKGMWKDYIEKIISFYKEKYDYMISGLSDLKKAGISFHNPGGGLSIWVRLPKDIDAVDLYEECSRRKLAIVPGRVFYLDESEGDEYIRLSFSSVSIPQIDEGIKILTSILEEKNGIKIERYMPFL